ncbi:MAG: DUF3179 domain-containing protein [bacterium]
MIKLLVFAIFGVILYRIFLRRDYFVFPSGEYTKNKKIKRIIKGKEKEIIVQETSGIFHKIPFYEIISAGPRKDGIPPIDNPKFIPIKIADDYLSDIDMGIAVNIKGINRFYPFKILAWHQVVNDIFNGKKILVAYCPLCFSGVAFYSLVDEEQVEFGTSGMVWNSNSLIYDRKTESLWSLILGEAIYGEMTGTKLDMVDFQQINYGGFKKIYPNGEALSRDTGFFRFYDDDPYEEYYRSSENFFPISKIDARLANRDLILGIIAGGNAKAYSFAKLREEGVIKDNFANKKIVAKYNEDMESASLFEEHPIAGLVKLPSMFGFWFSWAAAYPETEVYK